MDILTNSKPNNKINSVKKKKEYIKRRTYLEIKS